MVANIVIQLEGETAKVLSNWTVVQNGEQGPHVEASAGGYEDRMVRPAGRWMFAYRKIDRFLK